MVTSFTDTIVIGLMAFAAGVVLYKYGRNILSQTPADALAVGALILGISLMMLKCKRENMGGYGIISGLNYNNKARHCFKNIYEPETTYCETIGTVVI